MFLNNEQETNTEEKFKTSVVLRVMVLDGDDQYPRFLPCVPVSPGAGVCINPIYTANVTRWHQVNNTYYIRQLLSTPKALREQPISHH